MRLWEQECKGQPLEHDEAHFRRLELLRDAPIVQVVAQLAVADTELQVCGGGGQVSGGRSALSCCAGRLLHARSQPHRRASYDREPAARDSRPP